MLSTLENAPLEARMRPLCRHGAGAEGPDRRWASKMENTWKGAPTVGPDWDSNHRGPDM